MRIHLVLALAGLTACSLDWSKRKSDESPLGESDAGPVARDAGQVERDAAVSVDAAVEQVDAAIGERDASWPLLDALVPERDASTLVCERGSTLAADGRTCTPFAWGDPVALETNTGLSDSPKLVVDSGGHVTVVWTHDDDQGTWSNRYEPGAGWLGAMPIYQKQPLTDSLALTQLRNGDVMAIWALSGTLRNPVTWSYFRAGQGWSAAAEREATARYTALAADGDAVLAVWTMANSSSKAVTSRYRPATGWESDVPLVSSLPHIAVPSVTLDGAQHAHVLSAALEFNPMGPSNVSAASQRESSAGTWTTAEMLENEAGLVLTSGIFARTLADGDVLVAWSQRDASSVVRTWTRRFDVATSAYGGRAEVTGITADDAGEMLGLATDASGTAIMIGKRGSELWAARHVLDRWEPARLLHDGVGDAELAMDGEGNAIVVIGDGMELWACRYRAAEDTWLAPERIAAIGTGPVDDVGIVIDADARATVVWSQKNVDVQQQNVFAVRLEAE